MKDTVKIYLFWTRSCPTVIWLAVKQSIGTNKTIWNKGNNKIISVTHICLLYDLLINSDKNNYWPNKFIDWLIDWLIEISQAIKRYIKRWTQCIQVNNIFHQMKDSCKATTVWTQRKNKRVKAIVRYPHNNIEWYQVFQTD